MKSLRGSLRHFKGSLSRPQKELTQRRMLASTAWLLNTNKDTSLRRDVEKKLESKSDQPQKAKPHKSVAQADEELREKLEQMSGGGGASGIEYEDGKPSTMKRSVRNNMFRYI